MENSTDTVRIDKWLWAARFFKTRRLAHDAIEGGKVHIDGQKCKASKKITLGLILTIKQGFMQKSVKVTGLSEVRKGAPEAQKLYEETQESILNREKEAEIRRLGASVQVEAKRPTKKQRRDLIDFKKKNLE